MDDAQVQRITGWSGVAIAVLAFATVPLYFIYDGPPPASNVFTRNLIGLISLAFMISFFAGFAHLLRRAGTRFEWLASVFQSAGMLFVAVALVAISLETGVVFGAPDGTLDPTTDGPLAEGNMLIHGSIKRLLTVVMLWAAGYAFSAHAGAALAGIRGLRDRPLQPGFRAVDVLRQGRRDVLQRHRLGELRVLREFPGLLDSSAIGIVLLRRPTPPATPRA